ncbi:FG-GAP-like repeat-containing protein [Flavobacterium hungaricum]|uniref:RHS repeat-associated core domain-containing protein n=1 Tax=Flavobacterium hungaricum TaxID=2082725 RepID=A0ABR9TM91_9FLAO|nr:FG-GAP-like repeat-containing protein [Flavobacterium hungaricum]MBE8726458.1 hypothetical protein [Flavobacterium hungaricum]
MKQFYFSILFLIYSFTASAQFYPINSSSEVGIIDGKLNISLTGAANYSVPIAVPPGITGVVPQISVDYSSRSPFQGTAAQGWDIGGVSAITRIPSTKFHDGVIDPVDFDVLDRFALNGQRLIVKNGTDTYGAHGTVYETEYYSNLKITSYGVHPNGSSYGPAYFIVEYPDGTKAYYGNSADSRSVTDWSITSWINPQGAQISYEYLNSTNSLYISSIKYGTLTPAAPINEIQFIYTTRTAAENGYVGGINIVRDKNLSQIKVTGNGIGFRNYQLRYDELDVITQIDEKSGDNTKAYNPTIFWYTPLTEGIHHLPATSNINLADITTKNTASISGDFDSDGKMDLILYRTSGTDMKNKYWLYTNIKSDNTNIATQENIGAFEDIFPVTALSSTNIVMPQGWAITKKTDTNYTFTIYSKGNVSSIAPQYSKVVNFPLDLIDETCTSLCALTSQTGRIFPKKIISGDFNGDGLTDVIAFDLSASHRYCKENTSTGRCTASNEDAVSRKTYFVDLKRDLTANFLFYAGELPNSISAATRIEVADFNGDGKSDFFIFDQGYVRVFTLSETNTLNLLYQNTASDPAITSGMPILMGDYNGDGKFEFLIPNAFNSSNWSKYTSTGISLIKENITTAPPYSANNATSTNNFFSTDINNDGKTDLVNLKSFSSGTATISVYPNRYDSFTPYPQTYSVNDPSISMDMLPIYLPQNMQSLSNTVNSVNSTLEIAFITQSKINYFTAEQNLRQSALLAQIFTGNGVEETIEYSTLKPQNVDSDGNYIYTPSTNLTYYPNLDLRLSPNTYIVSKIQQKSKDATRKRQFYYYGAVSNFQGLGFINFQSVNQTDWFDDTTAIFSNVVNNQINLRGAPTESFRLAREYAPDGSSAPADFITKSIITYNTPADALQSNKVFKLKTLNSNEFNSLNNSNSETANIVYDTFNNITSSTTTVKEGTSTLQTINAATEYFNAPSSSTYIVGRPAKKTQTAAVSGSTMTSEQLFTYTNNLLTQTKKKGTNTGYITEDNEFDGFGNLKKQTISSPNVTARVTSYEYDSTGRFVTKITDPESLSSTFEYNTNNGTLTKQTDKYGQSISYTYDSWFKMLTSKDELLDKTKSFTYTRNNEKTSITVTDDLDGSISEETFDDLGRKIKSGTKNLNDSFSYVSYLYDIFDRNYKISEPYIGSSPTQWNETKYDIYSRPTQNIQFNGRTVSSAYSVLSAAITDGQKNKTIYNNALGQISSVNETIGGSINYTYFADGNLKKTSYNGQDIIIEQDGWGRKTKLTDPNAGIFTYTNNDIGELTQETSQNGNVTTTITRDLYGRPTKKTVAGGGTSTETNYTYNSLKLPLTIHFKDNNEPAGSNETLTTYIYDNLHNRPTSISEEKFGISKFTTSFEYDTSGRIAVETKKAEVGGKISTVVFKYVYKNGSLHKFLDANNQTLWQVNAINAKGQILESISGNGIKATSTYDTDGYLSKIQYDKTISSTDNLLTLTTQFDKNTDNLKKRINSSFGNYTETFFYDDLNRLTEFTNNSGVQEIQNYQAYGVIKDNNLGAYGYDPSKPYQNTSITLSTEAADYYSNRGNIAEKKLSISYNAFKSPIQIEESGIDKISFTYNANDQRSTMYYGSLQDEKVLRPLHKHYSADGTMEVKQNIQKGETEFITYMGGDAYSAPVIVKSNGINQSDLLYLHRDYQGSIMAVTNSSGTLIEKRLYDAWGSIIQVQDGSGSILSGLTVIDRGYTGHEHLQTTGLINMNARLYDPKIHRFLQVDNYIQDLTDTQNYNPYGYVLNNPLLYTDPSGNLTNKFWNTLLQESAQSGSTMWYPDGYGNFDRAGTNQFINRDGDIGTNEGIRLPNITINSRNGDAKNARLIQDHVYKNSTFYSSSLNKPTLIDIKYILKNSAGLTEAQWEKLPLLERMFTDRPGRIGGSGALGFISGGGGMKFVQYSSEGLKLLKSTEIGAQGEAAIAKFINMLKSGDPAFYNDGIYVYLYKGEKFIVDGHNRIEAAIRSGESIEAIEFSGTKFYNKFAAKIEEIWSGVHF